MYRFLVVWSLSCVRCFVTHGLQPTRLLCWWHFPTRILEWVAISSSWVSFQLRDWTRISCIASGFFTTEPPEKHRFPYLFIICLSYWNINIQECRGYCFAHCYPLYLGQSSVQQVLKNICCSNAFTVWIDLLTIIILGTGILFFNAFSLKH